MPTIQIQVASGENLAALLKAFPEAKVDTLFAERGCDSWRLTVDTDTVAIDDPGKCEACGAEVASKSALLEVNDKPHCIHCVAKLVKQPARKKTTRKKTTKKS